MPEGANWNGKDELLVTAEEFEAALSGNDVAPKKTRQRPSTKAGEENGAQADGSGCRWPDRRQIALSSR